MFVIKKPSKIIFLGEHSAVYGFPVIGTTMPLYMYLVYMFSNSWKYLGAPSLKIDKVIHFINKRFNKVRPIEFLIFSEVPVGVGLGSSASLSLCFAEYIITHKEYETFDKILLAREIENIFHGKSSGMDILLIELNGTFYLENNNNALSAQKIEPCDFYFLIGAVKREVETSKIISDLNQKISLNNSLFEIVEELGVIAKDSYSAFSRRDFCSLVNNINIANNCLNSLDLSSDSLDYIIKRGREFKALAGKLSGAGRGGAFILAFKEEHEARLALKKLSKDLDKNNISLILKLRVFKV
ncbi:mevalonate kinase [Borrelia turcica IST7]|uniref:mevalonate kinase n=1 Tax=Borrelia turcica IST7 TaxID=1104446 RepID=A0A386PNQ9_9SPIR|nr:mevalonate kinase [Borrelia turcica]AYE36537.1 mevalonate kinase [Borrelia turcica IST7]